MHSDQILGLTIPAPLATTAYDVIPNAIDQLQAAGYNLVTLAECLGTQPYQNVGQPGSDDVCYLFLCCCISFLIETSRAHGRAKFARILL